MVDWLTEYWHDVLDVASVLGTVAAAGLAWLAIRNGNKQAKASADALVQERRIDFELDHLTELDEAFLKSEGGAPALPVQRCLRLLPAGEFRRLREYFSIESTPEGATELRRLYESPSVRTGSQLFAQKLDDGTTYRDALTKEIHGAIERRLAERR